MWKMISGIFEINLTFHLLITVVFWLVLAPDYEPEDWGWKSYTRHGGGFLIMGGDFALNKILIEKRHWVFSEVLILFYSVNLIAYRYIEDETLYSFASLDSLQSWLNTFALGVIFSLVHLFLAIISGFVIVRDDLEVANMSKGISLIIMPDDNDQ